MSSMLQAKLHRAMVQRLDLSTVLSPALHRLVTANSDAIGSPPEFILYPLLTTTAAFMGVNASISINAEWKEPAIMWFIVGAKKGEKKTAALRRLKKPIEALERQLLQEWEDSTAEDKEPVPKQICIDHFSFEELHSIMKRNNGRILGFFDEMTSLYAQLDLFKHSGSTMDRKTLITLNGGGPWTRNFRSYSATIPNTAFNMTGFIQPTFVERLLLSEDADGFNDRQMFDFPPDRDVHFDELKVPVPDDVPSLHSIFDAVMNAHTNPQHYCFDADGLASFKIEHDSLVDEKAKTTDEDVQGILAKARGYMARTVMILHSLEQAVTGSNHEWICEIGEDTVVRAAAIIRHLSTQKMIMMGKALNESSDQETHIPQEQRLRKLLHIRIPADGFLTPSIIGHKHISERVGSSYPVTKAIELLGIAVDMGFGEFVEIETPSKRKVKKFKKRQLEDLDDTGRNNLKRMKISEEVYQDTFRQPLAPIHTN